MTHCPANSAILCGDKVWPNRYSCNCQHKHDTLPSEFESHQQALCCTTTCTLPGHAHRQNEEMVTIECRLHRHPESVLVTGREDLRSQNFSAPEADLVQHIHIEEETEKNGGLKRALPESTAGEDRGLDKMDGGRTLPSCLRLFTCSSCSEDLLHPNTDLSATELEGAKSYSSPYSLIVHSEEESSSSSAIGLQDTRSPSTQVATDVSTAISLEGARSNTSLTSLARGLEELNQAVSESREEDERGPEEMEIGRTFKDNARSFTCISRDIFSHLNTKLHEVVFPHS